MTAVVLILFIIPSAALADEEAPKYTHHLALPFLASEQLFTVQTSQQYRLCRNMLAEVQVGTLSQGECSGTALPILSPEGYGALVRGLVMANTELRLINKSVQGTEVSYMLRFGGEDDYLQFFPNNDGTIEAAHYVSGTFSSLALTSTVEYDGWTVELNTEELSTPVVGINQQSHQLWLSYDFANGGLDGFRVEFEVPVEEQLGGLLGYYVENGSFPNAYVIESEYIVLHFVVD